MKIGIRSFILILLLVISLWYLLFPVFFKTKGVRVISIDKNAKCDNLKVGDLITEIEGKRIKNKDDFNKILSSLIAGSHITMVVNGGPGSCTVLNNSVLGIEVKDIGSKSLKFSVDLVGGEKVLISAKPPLNEEDASYISNILEKRLKVAGVQDSKISVDEGAGRNIKEIIIYAPSSSELRPILEPGKLEGVIEELIRLTNGSGKIKVGTESYDISWNGSDILTESGIYKNGEIFDVEGIKFRLVNATNESIIVDGLIFSNKDIKTIPTASSYVKYDSLSRRYQFSIPIKLSEEASEKFSKITNGLIPLGEIGSLERTVLNGKLIYYLDGNKITELSIPSDMAGEPIKTISIIGFEQTMKEAINKKMLIDIALEGEIDKKLYIDDVERFDGRLSWIIGVCEAVLIAIISVLFTIGVLRYKNLKIAIAGVLILCLEIVYIFGVIMISQYVFASSWIVDVNSLIGVCAFAVVSATQTVLLSEKILKRWFIKRYTHFLFLTFIIGFLILFTPVSRFGLVLITGLLIGASLTKPIYSDFLMRFR